jgi:hypothetical protein
MQIEKTHSSPVRTLMGRIPPNRAFEAALRSMAHPLAIIAVLLLLLNDHWLRWVSPSWLTGKLGDFTWLVFAPFIAAAALAWIIPPRIPRHEAVVRWLAFVLIGLWFALAKTVPFVHVLTTAAWESIIGWQGSLRMDASDLLALPALLIGWWIWQDAARRPASLRPIASISLALGIVATLASDGPVYSWSDSGITYICKQGPFLVTSTEAQPLADYINSGNDHAVGDPDDPDSYEITRRHNVFRSHDGGLTWSNDLEENYRQQVGGNCSQDSANEVTDPRDPSLRYRWTPGERIERSTDAGQTWIPDYELAMLQQDVRSYYNHYSSTAPYGEYTREYLPSPVSGLVDDETGNLVLAMSWDGVLVRTASDGQWKWVSLGEDYQLAVITRFDELTTMLFFEFWLAGALVFLVVTTSTLYIRHRLIGLERFIFAGTGWLGWFAITFLLLPDSKVSSDSFEMHYITVGLVSLPLLVFLAIPLSVGSVWDIARNYRQHIRPIVLVGLSSAVLFLLPLVAWTQGTIPRYITALSFAVLLAFSALIAGHLYLKERLPVEKPKKKKLEDEIGSSSDIEESIIDGSQIREITSQGIRYMDADGEEQFIDFAACYDNYVKERLSPERWALYKELNPKADNDWDHYVERIKSDKEVAQRNILSSRFPYIEFYTQPPTRFKFASEEAYREVRQAIEEAGWRTGDLS